MDKGLGLVLPAEGQEIEIRKENILNCLINSQGQVLLGGEPTKVKDISKVVRRKLAENDKLIISVKAHEKTKYEDYIAVIDQLKMANATRISIAETG
jgi:biopolymer transport protein ExbD